MDKDQVSGLVFIDYKKAFDLIDHDILLSKLETYGVAPKELLLFKDYLKGRRQSVVIDAVQSEYRLITRCSAGISPGAPIIYYISTLQVYFFP